MPRRESYSWTSANVGLVTVPVTPYPLEIDWTSVVFPAPRSPAIASTSGADAARPKDSPHACSSVSVTASPTLSTGSNRCESIPRTAPSRVALCAQIEYLVAQTGGRLEVELLGRVLHLLFETGDELVHV